MTGGLLLSNRDEPLPISSKHPKQLPQRLAIVCVDPPPHHLSGGPRRLLRVGGSGRTHPPTHALPPRGSMTLKRSQRGSQAAAPGGFEVVVHDAAVFVQVPQTLCRGALGGEPRGGLRVQRARPAGIPSLRLLGNTVKGGRGAGDGNGVRIPGDRESFGNDTSVSGCVIVSANPTRVGPRA